MAKYHIEKMTLTMMKVNIKQLLQLSFSGILAKSIRLVKNLVAAIDATKDRKVTL